MLSGRGFHEADRIYSILTRELGLIRASAIGVRKETSKLRGALEPFSLSEISLVRGKEYWRVTSAQFIEKFANATSIAKPLSLLEKLVQGESAHPELFDAIEKFASLYKGGDKEFEIRFVAIILFHLGYLKEVDLNLDKKELVKAINEGLQSSHLL